MKTIGLDLSINSTGICVCVDGKPEMYYIIANTTMTKKNQRLAESLSGVPLQYFIYEKQTTKSKIYAEKERIKTNNISEIATCIIQIIRTERPDYAFIEGVSYGSLGSAALVDLSGLNFVTRYILDYDNIPFIIVSPTENKKNATGNGAAKKEEMIYAWEACDDRLKELGQQLKLDDLADAFFLAKTPIENKIN